MTYPEFGAVTQPMAGSVVRPRCLREWLLTSSPEVSQIKLNPLPALIILIILLMGIIFLFSLSQLTGGKRCQYREFLTFKLGRKLPWLQTGTLISKKWKW